MDYWLVLEQHIQPFIRMGPWPKTTEPYFATPLARLGKSFLEMVSSVKPQFKQTKSSGNIKMDGLSRLSCPGRCTLISALNFNC
jgi:hypothetical protein